MFERADRNQEHRAVVAAVLWAMQDETRQRMLLATVFDGDTARMQSWAETYGLELRASRIGRLLVTNADLLAIVIGGDEVPWLIDSVGSLGYLDGYEYFRFKGALYRAPMEQPIRHDTKRRRQSRRCTLAPEQVPLLTNRDGTPKTRG
jgi:hypothetical protein